MKDAYFPQEIEKKWQKKECNLREIRLPGH